MTKLKYLQTLGISVLLKPCSDYLVSICMKKVTTLCVYLSSWKINTRSNFSLTKKQFCKQKEKHLLPGSHAENESWKWRSSVNLVNSSLKFAGYPAKLDKKTSSLRNYDCWVTTDDFHFQLSVSAWDPGNRCFSFCLQNWFFVREKFDRLYIFQADR